MDIFIKTVQLINTVIKYFLILMMFVMVVVVFLQVVYRFVLDNPLAWTEETARYLLVWITFLGAAYAMGSKAHIGVDLFMNMLPKSLRKILLIITTLLSLVFFAVMVTQGYILSQRTMMQTSPAMGLPMGYVYLVIPISGVLLMINLLYTVIGDLRGEES